MLNLLSLHKFFIKNTDCVTVKQENILLIVKGLIKKIFETFELRCDDKTAQTYGS